MATKNIQLKDGNGNLLMPRGMSDNILVGSKYFANDLSVTLPTNISGNTPSGGGRIFSGGNKTAVVGKYYFMVAKIKVNSLSKGVGVQTASIYVSPLRVGSVGSSITRTMLFHNSIVDPINDEFYIIQCFTVDASTDYIPSLVISLSPINSSNIATFNIDILNFACYVVDNMDDVRLLSSYYYNNDNFNEKGIFTGVGDLQEYIDSEFENYINNSEYVKVKALNFAYYGLDGLETSENYACSPSVIKCGKNDKLRFVNYGINPVVGGGFALCYYLTNALVDGIRVNGSDLTLISDGVYEWISPTDCYLGINNFVSANYAQEVFVEFYHEFANKTKIEPIDSKQVDVIIFMGQSNMAGRGITSAAHPEDAPNVIEGAGYEFRAITDPTKLYPLDKTFGLNENVSGAIDDRNLKTGGPVPSFVNSYFSQTYTPVICVSASEGGTAIDEWLPNTARLNDAINRLTLCKNYLISNNYTIRHTYMAWCQGEHEGGTSMTKDAYKTNFLSMLDSMKNEGVEVCLMIQIGEYNGSTTAYIEGYRKIQQAQLELTQENNDIIMASDSFKLMKSRGLMKDDFHYYQEAYNIVGMQAGINSGNFCSVTNSQIKDIFYIEI